MRCGKLLEKGEIEYCRDCKKTVHSFDRGRALYVYNDTVKAAITRFKFGNRPEYAGYFGEQTTSHLEDFIMNSRPDAIVPVPVSKEKLKRRGYNQAELLARQISSRTGIPVNTSMVTRIQDTTPMKELGRAERMKNLKGVFKVGVIDVECRNVLVVDDIYTTGSTMDAMADVLKQNGVERVFFVTLAAGISV